MPIVSSSGQTYENEFLAAQDIPSEPSARITVHPSSNQPEGLLEQGNINLNMRPIVQNEDGSISTVRSMSFEQDGKQVLVPTVIPGKGVVSNDEAIQHYQDTGEHLGIFDTPDNATAYAQSLHKQQEQLYNPNSTGSAWVDAGPKYSEAGPVSFMDVLKSAANDTINAPVKILKQVAGNAQALVNSAIPKDTISTDDPLPEQLAAQSALDVGMLGSAVPRPANSLGMFGGRKGQIEGQNSIVSLFQDIPIHKAKERLMMGEDPVAVYKDTGVFEGPDGRLRFEISDEGARLKTENLEKSRMGKELSDPYNAPDKQLYKTPYRKMDLEHFKDLNRKTGEPVREVGPATVGEILDHPELFKYYPELKDIKLNSGPLFNFGNIRGAHYPDKNEIFVLGGSEERMLSTLLHELQHAVQTKEGFARGGNTQEFKPASEMFKNVENMSKELDKKVNEHYTQVVSEDLKDISGYTTLDNKPTAPSIYTIEHIVERFVTGKELPKYDENILRLLNKDHHDFLQNVLTNIQAKAMLRKFDEEALTQYTQLYGEYEARATQERQALSDRLRREVPPWEDSEFKRTYPDGIVPEESVKHQ